MSSEEDTAKARRHPLLSDTDHQLLLTDLSRWPSRREPQAADPGTADPRETSDQGRSNLDVSGTRDAATGSVASRVATGHWAMSSPPRPKQPDKLTDSRLNPPWQLQLPMSRTMGLLPTPPGSLALVALVIGISGVQPPTANDQDMPTWPLFYSLFFCSA